MLSTGAQDDAHSRRVQGIALAKLEEAQRNKRRRKSLTQAAEAWRLLALRVSQLESQLKDRAS